MGNEAMNIGQSYGVIKICNYHEVPSGTIEYLFSMASNDVFLGDIVYKKKVTDVKVFKVGNKYVGFAIPRVDSDGKYRTGPIYVLPEHRGKGYAGTFVMQFFSDKPGRAWIADENISSLKMFTRAGFKKMTGKFYDKNDKMTYHEYIKR